MMSEDSIRAWRQQLEKAAAGATHYDGWTTYIVQITTLDLILEEQHQPGYQTAGRRIPFNHPPLSAGRVPEA